MTIHMAAAVQMATNLASDYSVSVILQELRS